VFRIGPGELRRKRRGNRRGSKEVKRKKCAWKELRQWVLKSTMGMPFIYPLYSVICQKTGILRHGFVKQSS
jgi:cytochrome c oxidase assembly protein Cox11